MNTIAWAIVVAAFIMMPNTDKNLSDAATNIADIMFLFSIAMLLYWTFK